MKFGCSIGIFLNLANLICRSTDISKCFRGSLRLRDNESQLYMYLRVSDVESPISYSLTMFKMNLQTGHNIEIKAVIMSTN